MTVNTTFVSLAEVIEKLTGLNITPEKHYLFENRLPEVMREFQVPSFADLLREINNRTNLQLLNRVIEKITTHETRFFRDEKVFSAFSEQILPEWKERNMMENAASSPLVIWSAACATGQEAYSIAMAIAENHPNLTSHTTILASDIAEESLIRARAGIYTPFELSRGLPESYRKRYFTETAHAARIRSDLLPSIVFSMHNLTSDPPPAKFDIIFCRNVAYYFSQDTRRLLFQKLQAALKPDGVLILGTAETPSGYLEGYITREFAGAHYYELNTTNVTLFTRNKLVNS